MSFESEYKDLLIKQYWGKPNATAEVELLATNWKRVYELLASFPAAFDVDLATGHRLSIIGKLVGLPRTRFVPMVSDEDYRFYLKVKIAKNTGAGYIVSDQYTSIQEVIALAFEGAAYAVDNQDMTLQLYITFGFSLDRLATLVELDLLPKPQGVRYARFIQSTPDETFGFASNPHSKGFASKFDLARSGGVFARKVIL